MLDHALAYAARGWHIFPCHYPIIKGNQTLCSCDAARAQRKDKEGNPLPLCTDIGKHPKTYNGFYDATNDPKTIRELWRDKNANIGLPGGQLNNLFIVDVDNYHQGDETLATLEKIYGPLPQTLRAESGSGSGSHIFFNHIPNLSNKVGELGKGLDTRTQGGYVIISPSFHKSGHYYRWLNDEQIVDAPQWLIDLAKLSPNLVCGDGLLRQSGYWARIAQGVREGERHIMILKLSGLLLGVRRIEPILALALVRAFNAQYCKPPLSDDAVGERFSRVVKRQTFHER
jgi:hypothetical protein